MKNFKLYRTKLGWNIEVSGGFYFNDLTAASADALRTFLLNLGYEEFWGISL